MKLNATPNCAFFWEANMYIYQKSKPKFGTFGVFNIFFNYKQKGFENKIKLWKTPCHVELHQMQLYMNVQGNDFIFLLDDKQTLLSLVEINFNAKNKNSRSPPLLYIKNNKNYIQNENHSETVYSKNNNQIILNELISTNNNNDESINNSQDNQDLDNFFINEKNDLFLYCNNYDEENDLILTADEEETLIQLSVSIQSAFVNNEIISIKDFKFISVIGQGNFGKVTLVESIPHPENYYALKSIHKMKLAKLRSIKAILNERSALSKCKNPFIVSLKFSFQTATKFYLGMEFICGGDLRNCINKSYGLTSTIHTTEKIRSKESKNSHDKNVSKKEENDGNYIESDNEKSATSIETEYEFFSTIKKSKIADNKNDFLNINKNFFITFKDVQIYVAELALALYYLNSNGIIYRDLKPDNVMICEDGHIKLVDFGLSLEIGPTGYSRSLCGTLEYIAPEMIKHLKYSFAVDWWSLGIVVYELIFTRTPFRNKGKNRQELFDKILNEPIRFPKINKHEEIEDNIDSNSVYCTGKLSPFDELQSKGFCVGLTGSIVDFSSIKDFICNLCAKNQNKRLMFGKSFTEHPFWGGLNFDDIAQKKFAPSFIPSCNMPTENFNDKFTNMEAHDSFATLPVGHKSVCINGFSFFSGSFLDNGKNSNNSND